jgi:hypothetical protein
MKSAGTFNGDYLKVCDSGHFIKLLLCWCPLSEVYLLYTEFQELALLHLQVTDYHYADRYSLLLYLRIAATDENEARTFFSI